MNTKLKTAIRLFVIPATCLVIGLAAGSYFTAKRFHEAIRFRDRAQLADQISGLNTIREGRIAQGIETIERSTNFNLIQLGFQLTPRAFCDWLLHRHYSGDPSEAALTSMHTYVEAHPESHIILMRGR